MNIELDRRESFTIITINSEKLDTKVAPELKSTLVLLNSDGVKHIIFNLIKVKYCDSSGLSAILVANRLCKNSNGSLVITNLQESVKKLITISQLDSILMISNELDEGIQLISSRLA